MNIVTCSSHHAQLLILVLLLLFWYKTSQLTKLKEKESIQISRSKSHAVTCGAGPSAHTPSLLIFLKKAAHFTLLISLKILIYATNLTSLLDTANAHTIRLTIFAEWNFLRSARSCLWDCWKIASEKQFSGPWVSVNGNFNSSFSEWNSLLLLLFLEARNK